VRIGDTTVDDGDHYLPPERRRIGYVPQEGALFPHLTVIANIGFGLPRRDRKGAAVRRLVDMVGLSGYEDRYPHQLSGGQQQRVAIARALTVDPQLVLLDEPFASLDASLRAAVRADVVRILRAAGTTTVLVTHDQDEAFAMADRLAIIRAGRITPTAAPSDFYAHPLDPDMAAFVGEANLLAGTIDGDHATTVLGQLPLRVGTGAEAYPPATPAIVLVRPEQVDICTDAEVAAGAGGLGGRVVHTDYHGHDVLVTIRPVRPSDRHADSRPGDPGVGEADGDGSEFIVARVDGTRTFPRDAHVTIRAHGTVLAWPARP
jgi:iron(III) transport system ATP-binding protein